MKKPVEDAANAVMWRFFSQPKRIDFGLGKAAVTTGKITDPDKDSFLHAVQVGRLLTPDAQPGEILTKDSLSESYVVMTFQSEEHAKAVTDALLGIGLSETHTIT